ncbi:unnamed protein product, partial [Iphiclides podalirius]
MPLPRHAPPEGARPEGAPPEGTPQFGPAASVRVAPPQFGAPVRYLRSRFRAVVCEPQPREGRALTFKTVEANVLEWYTQPRFS